MKTKKEITELYKSGSLNKLMAHIITDNTQSDIVNALYLLFKAERGEYNVTFESVPYSRGGRYARHTSTLHSIQSWDVYCFDGNYYIRTNSTSKSVACPPVIIPKFYTEKGKAYFNSKIHAQISDLQKKILK